MTFEEAAKELANYINSSDGEHEQYAIHIADGNDPRDHITYTAAIVLGFANEYEDDIQEYLLTSGDNAL